MRALLDVKATEEQLTLFSRFRPGAVIIRGAAGSGKTTTALLKLKSIITVFLTRKIRERRVDPIRVLALTFNRTLSGYIKELAEKKVENSPEIELEVSTFSKWAIGSLGRQNIISKERKSALLADFARATPFSSEFVEEEVDYVLGRFFPEARAQYLDCRREGRGGTPRMDRPTRELFMANVIEPYIRAKNDENLKDWNDLAVEMAVTRFYAYDIVVIDETQDFSGNQIRAIMNQVAAVHSATFVLDSVQRIYANGFTWQELGIEVRPENSFRLNNNYRNTQEIARFAASIINGIGVDDDGTLPNFARAMRAGSKPIVLTGIYRNQVSYALQFIKANVDLTSESVAFLHPLGWFNWLRDKLNEAGLPFVDITREPEWPDGPENIALSTLHSAKGLEFDHVFILGLNGQVTQHGEGPEDERLITLRRLLAMGVGRAKKTVTLGYQPADPSAVMAFLDPATFDHVPV